MRAVTLNGYVPMDEPAAFMDTELPLPEPDEHDLRVRVEAVALNHVRLHAATPERLTPPRVLGYDAAGVVDVVGTSVRDFRPGDRVYYAGDVDRPGSYAQHQLVDHRLVALRPNALDAAQAASLPLATLTAWELLFQRMPFNSERGGQGKSLLVIGGAGGVGSIAIQLARRAGFTVVATASRRASSDWCLAMGAQHVINHRKALAPQLANLGFTRVDAVINLFDTVSYWDVIGQLLAPQGHVGLIVAPSGTLSIGDPYKAKCISIHWEWMFARARFQTHDMDEQGGIMRRVTELIEAGVLKSIAGTVLSPINATNLREAHRRLDAGSAVGKLVLAGW